MFAGRFDRASHLVPSETEAEVSERGEARGLAIVPGIATDATASDLAYGFAPAEVIAIRAELSRLGILPPTEIPLPHERHLEQPRAPSGVMDGLLADALIEAFGGDEWRRLSGADVLARLRVVRDATPLDGHVPVIDAAPGARPRYGKMFADGVLDVTIAFGFDDMLLPYATVADNFAGLGLERDDAGGAALLARIGRSPATEPRFVRRAAIRARPPAGAERPIDVVVTLLLPDGHNGAQLAKSFQDRMRTSDATLYSGHGGYGTGPDFDAVAMFRLRTDDGTWRTISDLSDLKWALRGGMPELERRVADGSLVVDVRAAGNVLLNRGSAHPDELEGKIYDWLIARARTEPSTGPRGALADPRDDRYRMLAMIGCRTEDYRQGLRATPGYDPRRADLIDVDGFGLTGYNLQVASAFLAGLMTQSTTQELVRSIDRAYAGLGIVDVDGFTDNPRDARRSPVED